MTPDEPGCDLFVDAADQDAVLALLAAHLGVEPVFSFVSPPGFDVSVSRNPLAEPADPDDFVSWPTLVAVSARPGQDLADFVAGLTTALRTAGHRTVAVE